MRILIEPTLLHSALLNRGDPEENCDVSWKILQSQQYIEGYLSDRGLRTICDDIKTLTDSAKAKQVETQIRKVLKICPVTPVVITEARVSPTNFDLAVECTLAKIYKLDAILSSKTQEFVAMGLYSVSVETLLDGRSLHRFFKPGKLPLVIEGTLHDLRRLERLASMLHYLKSIAAETTQQGTTHLRHWLRGVYNSDWQPVEELLVSGQPAICFRKKTDRAQRNQRGKLLNLGWNVELALLIEVQPISKTEINVQVEICSTTQQGLPSALKLLLLDQEGKVAMGTQPDEDESLLLRFSVAPGETFSVRLTVGDTSITEAFVI